MAGGIQWPETDGEAQEPRCPGGVCAALEASELCWDLPEPPSAGPERESSSQEILLAC